MRIGKKSGEFKEGDMTPMIDIVFQLIAFFMVLVNFAEAEQDQRVNLPQSVLAKPPDKNEDQTITLHVTAEGDVVYGGREYTIPDVQAAIRNKGIRVESENGDRKKVLIIIRADENAKTGQVQELIKVCQDERFEKFALRARQEKPQ